MEYERIQKVQTGLISPRKLRMKLMGSLNLRKEGGSRSNSSRTSPSNINDSDLVKSGLLDSADSEFKHSVMDAETAPAATRKNEVSTGNPGDGGNPRVSLPVRFVGDENLDYDSNASPVSFEFHRGERVFVHHLTRLGSRHMSSKWNDAEKWIMGKQHLQQNHTNRIASSTNSVKITPEHSGGYNRPPIAERGYDTRRVDAVHPVEEMGSERFASGPVTGTPSSGLGKDGNSEGITTTREVSMRDMGTEMTPATSLEPSRTATPNGSATPFRSSTSSIPSTPRDEPAPTPVDEFSKRELTEEELKLKTKREIAALGVQLGKMNIAAWAIKVDSEKNVSTVDDAAMEELERLEYERRATAWEEAETTRHTARYKREEIRIQAWEIQQKAKLEAEMRKIEARVDQMRAIAQAKVVQKSDMVRQRSEEKRAAAVARKKRDAERTTAQAEYIRQTGRIHSPPRMCCGILC